MERSKLESSCWAGSTHYAERARSIYEKTNGPDNVEIGKVTLVLAEISKGQLLYEAAESFGTKALAIFEKTAGPDSLATGKALLWLADLHIKNENYAEASSLLLRADTLYLKTHAKKRLDTGKLLYYQGEILRLQGDPKKAHGLYKKALKYFKKRSKFHPDLGGALLALAACRKSYLKYIKAEELHREGLSILETSLRAESILLEEPIREMVELLNFNGKHLCSMRRNAGVSSQETEMAADSGWFTIFNYTSLYTWRLPVALDTSIAIT